jgi:hypothetical protein
MNTSDAELGARAVIYFGGRARAAHILSCDDCRIDEAGEFVACPRCPGARHGQLQHLRARGA